MAQIKVINDNDDQNLKYLTSSGNATTSKIKHSKNLKTLILSRKNKRNVRNLVKIKE